MNPAFAALGALALTLTTAGCGGSTSRPSTHPDLAGKPRWGDCSTFSEQQMSIAEGARGTATLKAALAHYREDGDRVVRGPSAGGLAHRWLVGDSATVHADLEVWHSGRGWFVTAVKRCAD